MAPRLVVIDSLFRLLRVRDASNYAAVIQAFDPLIAVARGSDTAMVFTHHQRKGGGTDGEEILGSQAIFGSIDNAVLLSRRGTQRTIRTQVRIGEDMPPTAIVLDKNGYVSLAGAHRECRAQRIDDDIVRCLADTGVSMTIGAIRRAVGHRTEDVNQALAGVGPRLIIANECLHGEGAPHCQDTTPVLDTISRAETTRAGIGGFGRASAASEWLARHAAPIACRSA